MNVRRQFDAMSWCFLRYGLFHCVSHIKRYMHLTQSGWCHRPRPPPSNPPRQGPDHPPGLVAPTRGLDQAHRQSPPGPDHPRQRPPRDHRRPRALASPQTQPGPARLDPPDRVGPGPDARHRHQRHASTDRTPTTGPSGDGPPSGPEPPGAVGTGHRAKPRHRPPRRRPPHPRRRPPPPTYRQ